MSDKTSIVLSHPTKQVGGTVKLTGSKSESNRALIIQALSKGSVQVANLSEAADTVTMNKAVQLADSGENSAQPTTIDIGPAGTAMRFLTSYLNLAKGTFELTGSARMQERPIKLLVDALQKLGANIKYLGKDGYPPLQIEGPMSQIADSVDIPGDISSQYISSLLLAAPALEKGLSLHIEGELTSKPYVSMTLDMLRESGISYEWNEQTIRIPSQNFGNATLYVEPDWSAASYWYSIVALSQEGSLFLPGLKKSSLQGDIAIANIMTRFGVHTTFQENGVLLQKELVTNEPIFLDLKECPDLAQTIVVVAAALKMDVTFTGLETLKIKETDRIAALQAEIGKFGCDLVEDNEIYHLKTSEAFVPEKLEIATYEDHRMAMAFAPLALVFPQVTILEPSVVEKSYPDFWLHLEQQHFIIK